MRKYIFSAILEKQIGKHSIKNAKCCQTPKKIYGNFIDYVYDAEG
jgi:hypothetical protein